MTATSVGIAQATRSPISLCPCSCKIPLNLKNPPPKSINVTPKPQKIQSLPLKISNCLKIPTPKTNPFRQLDSYPDEDIQISPPGLVPFRLQRLVSEFQSLPEPVDRVKRLLDYATVLPGLGGSGRTEENRVPGCAAQVWLEVERDEVGRMRFGADSDSEITKGFCSCLIFLLDGASPDDVLKVKGEDLKDMNVGLPVRSRVNSWHNVLVAMQERTKILAAEREEACRLKSLETFPPLVVSADNVIAKG